MVIVDFAGTYGKELAGVLGFDEERLRGDLRDYYGTAMFNGFPMAMMELEEAERASGDELRAMARGAGLDPADYEISPGRSSSGYVSPSYAPSVGVSVTAYSETIGPAATQFFGASGASSSEGFFAHYGKMLRDRALRDEEPSIGDNG